MRNKIAVILGALVLALSLIGANPASARTPVTHYGEVHWSYNGANVYLEAYWDTNGTDNAHLYTLTAHCGYNDNPLYWTRPLQVEGGGMYLYQEFGHGSTGLPRWYKDATNINSDTMGYCGPNVRTPDINFGQSGNNAYISWEFNANLTGPDKDNQVMQMVLNRNSGCYWVANNANIVNDGSHNGTC